MNRLQIIIPVVLLILGLILGLMAGSLFPICRQYHYNVTCTQMTWLGIASYFATIVGIVLLVDLLRKRKVRITNSSPPSVR